MYSNYILKNITTKVVSYLLKPINKTKIKEAVENWKEMKKSTINTQNQNIDEVLDHLKKEGFMKSKISVPISDGYEFIEVNDIIRSEERRVGKECRCGRWKEKCKEIGKK